MVLHVVIDTSQEQETDRISLFADGTMVGSSVNGSVLLMSALSPDPGDFLALGNRVGMEDSFAGAIFYAAL